MIKRLTHHFEENDRRIFWAVVWCTLFAVLLYIYFLGSSVYAVIARKQAEQGSAELLARISQLEAKYVVLDKGINLELAHREGFADVAVPRYVSTVENRSGFTLREAGVH